MKTAIILSSLLLGTLLLTHAPLYAQGGVDPADAAKPLSDQWITYSGDYSGKRYSLLKQVNTSTVKNLSLEWLQTGIVTGCGPTGSSQAAPVIVGGLGTGDANTCAPARLGGGILFVDGVIYASSPDNVWAIDARDGAILWHYYWKTRGGTSLATRGLGMWHNRIYFELHDDWMVCLDAKSGKEVWKKEISSFDAQYFSSNAPMVLGNHIIAGTGNDMDAPGFIKSYDPETGDLQWTLYTTPQAKGDLGLETWASLDAARHGGAM
ncbi:MAG: PQQ-binding-like beta-propeller repeat protein, partial [Terriglobia bacterium]